MKTKFDADELNLLTLAKKYSNENKARKLFEAMRWPGGNGFKLKPNGDGLNSGITVPSLRGNVASAISRATSIHKPDGHSATVRTAAKKSAIIRRWCGKHWPQKRAWNCQRFNG
jgi:hypothetical protein